MSVRKGTTVRVFAETGSSHASARVRHPRAEHFRFEFAGAWLLLLLGTAACGSQSEGNALGV